MGKIISLLDGGLGNKFNGLYSSIYLSKLYNKPLHINNVRNNMGNFDLKKLFNINYEYTEYTHTEFDTTIPSDVPMFLHKKYFNYNRNCQHISSLNNKLDTFIFLTDRLIMSSDDLKSVINEISIVQSLKIEINNFISKYNINKNTIGIHIRGSDSPMRSENINTSFNFIDKNRDKQIFVCTDEKEISNKIKNYSNVIYYNTTQFTEKFNKQLDWNGSVIDIDNRRWNYNADRNEQSVIEAFIELMILSKTNIVSNNGSSFLTWAKRFNESTLI